jgi:hypothetical protein
MRRSRFRRQGGRGRRVIKGIMLVVVGLVVFGAVMTAIRIFNKNKRPPLE